MNDNTALTPQEVAGILKIAKNTVYELIKRGELNAYRVGRKVRVDLKDVNEYKSRNKGIRKDKAISAAYNDSLIQGSNFVICGQDILLDILSRHLQINSKGVQALRSYVGSYNGLYALYNGDAQMATAHLWDGDTGEYNVPFVRRMLPGVSAVIINLACRLQGFYVAGGNPKEISGWEDLKRKDIVIINREKGSGTRVLLDEHLRRLGIQPDSIKGYNRESTSHLAIASTVARGGADMGIGNEKSGLQVKGIDFIPLQTERYDLVIKKEDVGKAPFQAAIEAIRSNEFRMELEGIGGYDLTGLGKVIAET
ncbi:putative molybdopterin biosynthesis protein [Ruminiclostridium sufflavum DSM 19573]|uniref:Putative molybdopterin biosynthesis protein n=1 Tax=Ruminiclostridium sufflavum DSM 19573 TaxID=1121337 RepID=A0A318XRT8_9FIRM|nr:helix-turn-helix transcriptional regulator [Ruminiclostridium sufflavum]PYG90214.1 putative molybdopterin biosynthesis protein [Ruminiclostridium sufflavum DSM 19573]